MAYMSQEKKAKIAAALKGIIPKDWKWSLSVNNHSSLVLSIWSAPVDLLAECRKVAASDPRPLHREAAESIKGNLRLNDRHLENHFSESLPLFEKINAALNDGNHDRSDAQSDYFDVGWYVDIQLGRWNKDFVCSAKAVAEA